MHRTISQDRIDGEFSSILVICLRSLDHFVRSCQDVRRNRNSDRAFAAFRLMTNSNFFGCSTGKSAGLAPLRYSAGQYLDALPNNILDKILVTGDISIGFVFVGSKKDKVIHCRTFESGLIS